MPFIEFDNFSVRFGKRALFDGVTGSVAWQVGGSGVIGLMGPSGSGKTTLLNALLTHRYLRRVPGLAIAPAELAIAHIPQQPVLYPHLSVEANARMFERVGRYRNSFDGVLFKQLVDTLRLRKILADGRTDRLSGGEGQRLMLLRSLSVRPDLLLLDEPCAGLDGGVRAAFLADLSALMRRQNCAALYVGHHWEEIAALASDVVYLQPSFEHNTVKALHVYTRQMLQDAPPTPDAFQAIYGPTTSIWPARIDASRKASLLAADEIASTSTRVIACLPPVPDSGQPAEFRVVGEFRLAAEKRASMQNAFLYDADRFLGVYQLLRSENA